MRNTDTAPAAILASHHRQTPEAEVTDTDLAVPRLRELCGHIDAWKAARNFSDGQLFRSISGLNDKTHGKIRRGVWEGIIPENHLPKYEAAWKECQAFDRRLEVEETLLELPPTAAVLGALESVKLNRGNDRFVLIEGESGAGKTVALKAGARQFADAHYITAHAGWEVSPTMAMGELLAGCDVKMPAGQTMPGGFAGRLELLTKALRTRPRLILIDEGQHLSGPVLNVVKHIINGTDCWIAVAALSCLWRKIQAARWPEVKQLLHNRMHLRLPLSPPDADSVETYLSARIGLDVAKEKSTESARYQKAFDEVARLARGNGLFAFVRKTTAAARLYSYQGNRAGKVSSDDILNAAASVAKNTRGFDAAAAA